MADSQVNVNEATGGTLTHLDADTLTVSAQTVKRERHRIAGNGATELMDVRVSAPNNYDGGAVVRPVIDRVIVFSAAGLSASGSSLINVNPFPDQQVSLFINIATVPTGTAPTITFSLQELDPGTGTNTFGPVVSTAALNAVGITVLTLPAMSGNQVKVSWTVTGTTPNFPAVYVTLVGKTTPFAVKAASTAAAAADTSVVVAISPNSATVTDGTNAATVKAASTAAVAADKALVVAISPNSRTVNVADLTGTAGSLITQVNTVVSGGSTGPLVLGSVLTAAPAYTTGNANALSLTTAGDLRAIAKVSDGTNTAAVKAASTAAIATDPALVVTISPNTPVNVFTGSSTTANAPSQQTVGTTSGSVMASNTARKKCFVVNTGSTFIYLGLGQTPTITAYHIALAPCGNSPNDGSGGTFVDDTWDGAINAISSAAGGTVCVTELT